MSKQENFNDILRSKFTERETPVNEEDWRKMRKTIDDSRKRKRRIIWISISTAALLLGFGIYEYTTTVLTPNEKIVSTNPPSTLTAANNITGSKNVTTGKPQVTAPVISKDPGSSKETALNPKPANDNKPFLSKTKPVIASVAHNVNPSARITAVVANRNSIASSKKQRHSTETSRVNTYQSTQTAKQDRVPSTFSRSVTNAIPNSSQPVKNIDTVYGSQTSSSTANITSEGSNSDNVGKKQDSVMTNKQITSAVQANATSLSIEENKRKDSIAKNQVVEAMKNNSSASKPDGTNKKSDSIPPTASELVAPLPPIADKTPKKNSFSIEAGAGYSLGWNYGDTAQGRGVNPIIGIGYTRKLSDKFALKTGLQVSSMGNMGTSPFIIKHVNYDFGYNSNDTSLKTNWLFYLTLPVQVEYKLGEKNAIGLGGTISYLLSGYGDVNVYNVTGNTTQTVNSYSQFMYVKGFNQWNASVFLLYKRTLFGKLSAYLIPYFGLMDIKNNSFFSQNMLERDSGLKLILSYTIL